MIVDLNCLEVRRAKELINWCIANDIDKERATELLFLWYTTTTDNITWELDIPEEHMTYFLLKWK